MESNSIEEGRLCEIEQQKQPGGRSPRRFSCRSRVGSESGKNLICSLRLPPKPPPNPNPPKPQPIFPHSRYFPISAASGFYKLGFASGNLLLLGKYDHDFPLLLSNSNETENILDAVLLIFLAASSAAVCWKCLGE